MDEAMSAVGHGKVGQVASEGAHAYPNRRAHLVDRSIVCEQSNDLALPLCRWVPGAGLAGGQSTLYRLPWVDQSVPDGSDAEAQAG